MSINSIDGPSSLAQSNWAAPKSDAASPSTADTTKSVSKLADGSTVTITRGAGDAIISVTTAATTSSTPPATTTSTVYITA